VDPGLGALIGLLVESESLPRLCCPPGSCGRPSRRWPCAG